MQISAKKAAYTRWLIDYLADEDTNFKYMCLANCLNEIEFYWLMPDDSNRNKDGLLIRNIYLDEEGDYILDELPGIATVLEVLVALSKRASKIVDHPPITWLSVFIDNLGLDFLSDRKWTRTGEAFTISTIHKWLDRRFSPNGSGSPFRSGTHDITKITMWNALNWYLADSFGEA
jgi:hypothetical protein